LALKNRYDLGILNGDMGTVLGTGGGAVQVRTGDRTLDLPLDYVTDHLQHGYARTVHKTQGLTCDTALLLGDDSLYAELGYTGLTRGRQENHLYTVVTTTDFDDATDPLAHVVRALDTTRAKTAAIEVLEGAEIA